MKSSRRGIQSKNNSRWLDQRYNFINLNLIQTVYEKGFWVNIHRGYMRIFDPDLTILEQLHTQGYSHSNHKKGRKRNGIFLWPTFMNNLSIFPHVSPKLGWLNLMKSPTYTWPNAVGTIGAWNLGSVHHLWAWKISLIFNIKLISSHTHT